MTIEIVFETHSISTDNEAGIATGRLHGELSEEGKRLARRLGERRRGERVDAIYTSDLERAVETAELATGRQWLGCAPFSTCRRRARPWTGDRDRPLSYRWALDHLLKGVPLEQLVTAPFEWQEGWVYELTAAVESTAARSDKT